MWLLQLHGITNSQQPVSSLSRVSVSTEKVKVRLTCTSKSLHMPLRAVHTILVMRFWRQNASNSPRNTIIIIIIGGSIQIIPCASNSYSTHVDALKASQ